jgi:hypothetical protein
MPRHGSSSVESRLMLPCSCSLRNIDVANTTPLQLIALSRLRYLPPACDSFIAYYTSLQ